MVFPTGGTRLADQQASMIGGLNTVSDDLVLGPTQLRKTVNARLTEYGAITKRGGTRRTSAVPLTTAPVLNGFTWRKDGGTQEILAVCGGTLFTGVYSEAPMSYTAQAGSLSLSTPPAFAQFRDGANDVVYIADGGQLNRWDGTTLTTSIPGSAVCSQLIVHNERLWSCGDPAAPDSIFYSPFNNGDGLGNGSADGGQIVVRTFGDETVVGLGSVGTSLIILHRRGVSRLTGYGQDDILVAPAAITSDVGLIAPKSTVNAGGLLYFVSERGLYRCNEQEAASVGTVDTPDPLLPIIRVMTEAQFSDIRCEYNRATREVWINLPGQGVFLYHTVLRAWSGPFVDGYLDPGTLCVFETLNESGLPILLRGDALGWVSVCDAGSPNRDNVSANRTGGTPYTMDVQFRRLYCGDDALAKAFRWGYLTANLRGSDNCTVRWQSENANGSYALPSSQFGVWGVGVWGVGRWNSGNVSSFRIPMGGTGYGVDVSVIDAGTGIPVFSRFQLEAFSLGRR